MPRGKSRKDEKRGYEWGVFDPKLLEDKSISEQSDHYVVLNKLLGLEGQDQLFPGKALTPLERAAISEEIEAIKDKIRQFDPEDEEAAERHFDITMKFLEAADRFQLSDPNFLNTAFSIQHSAVNMPREVPMTAVPDADQLQEDLPDVLYVSDPEERDHYQYLNLLLGLEGHEALKPGVIINEENKRKVMKIKEAIAMDEMNPDIEMMHANARKITHVIADLFNPSMKAAYDDSQRALTNGSIELHRPLREPIYLKPVQSIKNIIAEFGQFKNDWLREKPQHKEEQFSYSQSRTTPVVHTFTFPDEASCIAFLDRITNQKLAVRQDNPVPSDDMRQQTQPGLSEQEMLQQGMGNAMPDSRVVNEDPPDADPDEEDNYTWHGM